MAPTSVPPADRSVRYLKRLVRTRLREHPFYTPPALTRDGERLLDELDDIYHDIYRGRRRPRAAHALCDDYYIRRLGRGHARTVHLLDEDNGYVRGGAYALKLDHRIGEEGDNEDEVRGYDLIPDAAVKYFAPIVDFADHFGWVLSAHSPAPGSRADVRWLEQRLSQHGLLVDDLSEPNVGYLEGHPVVLDWAAYISVP